MRLTPVTVRVWRPSMPTVMVAVPEGTVGFGAMMYFVEGTVTDTEPIE